MKNTKKLLAIVIATATMASQAMPAMAAEWKQDNTGWWYQEDNGSYPTNSWKWINGRCYYFDSNGYMLASTTTPDGYTVDATGAWTVNGVVQTQSTGQTSGAVHHNENYDPAHPLANKVDEWHLRLTPESNGLNTRYIASLQNVHAMLTNQMEYYVEPSGPYGVEEQKEVEQALYNWYCNWLNSFDFENMSDMDKAKEIQKVFSDKKYEVYRNEGSFTNNPNYKILIEGKGQCADFAMTACFLAETIGLNCAITGTGNHAIYLIQVDDKVYSGSNQVLSLGSPTNEIIYSRWSDKTELSN